MEGKERVHQGVLACSGGHTAMGFVITRDHLRPQLCVISGFTFFLVQTFCDVTKGQDDRCDAARKNFQPDLGGIPCLARQLAPRYSVPSRGVIYTRRSSTSKRQWKDRKRGEKSLPTSTISNLQEKTLDNESKPERVISLNYRQKTGVFLVCE